MVTDEIMGAVRMMAEQSKCIEQKIAIECVENMLGDFSEEEWMMMSEPERREAMKQYLDVKPLLNKVIEKTIFEICTDGFVEGKKMVHFFGYGYATGEERGSDAPYKFVEFCGFEAPLEEVRKVGVELYVTDNAEDYKQYVTDCDSAFQLYGIYRKYDNGKSPVLIKKDDLKRNMPRGIYIITG